VARPRFVLRFGGDGVKPEADVARVAALPSVAVVDASSRMLLVEADAESDSEELRTLVDSLPGWVMAPEQNLPLPDTTRKAARPPV